MLNAVSCDSDDMRERERDVCHIDSWLITTNMRVCLIPVHLTFPWDMTRPCVACHVMYQS